jgi:ribonuclease PH
MRDPLKRRPLSFEINYLKNAEGSCLVKNGDTWVLASVTLEDRVPPFLKNTGQGWITAEYNMLPRSTLDRIGRDKVRSSGRTFEIQRLISRALRGAVNLTLLGERSIIVDCDVLQADGGTRTAAINGAYVALQMAFRGLQDRGLMARMPIVRHVSAISCGLVNNEILLDLNYQEDSKADIDANFVFTSENNFLEVQFSGEKSPVNQDQISKMLEISKVACLEIIDLQKAAIASALSNSPN